MYILIWIWKTKISDSTPIWFKTKTISGQTSLDVATPPGQVREKTYFLKQTFEANEMTLHQYCSDESWHFDAKLSKKILLVHKSVGFCSVDARPFSYFCKAGRDDYLLRQIWQQ